MASNFQQQRRLRKLVYGALILVLFTGALAWRKYAVAEQANHLAIREQSRGDVELSGATVRVLLTGSRGIATCVLWSAAQEQQKKNQWNELEVTVRSVAKLQPHFLSPWLFQSWNLAYNVSVESDRVHDKYFYITRGIELLAEGERQNRNNPDLRQQIGFYTLHKITHSDETNVLRSLFQLSCIPPNERDPARFWVQRDGRNELNLAEFEKFCKDNPQLVRRLRKGLDREDERNRVRQGLRKQQFTCEKPEDVVRFLADNQSVPSYYEAVEPAPVGGWQRKPDRPRDPLDPDRFPVLPPPPEDPRTHAPRAVPPQHAFGRETLTSASVPRDDDDAYAAAKAWFAYAQEPIPDPGDLPGSTREIENRTLQRKPRYMMTVIFRQYPAQAARFMAERLQEEGWYDDSGWDIADWFPRDRFSDGSPARVGASREWSSQKAWEEAHDLWRAQGQNNHLLLTPAEEKTYRDLVEELGKELNLEPGQPPPPSLRPEALPEGLTPRHLHAAQFLRDLETYRQVSNFMHHYYRSLVESRKETVQARKRFYEAEALRLDGSPDEARKKYESPEALPAWRDKVLSFSKGYRRDEFNQEETYEIQLRYLDLVSELNRLPLQWQAIQPATGALLSAPGAGAVPVGFVGWLAPASRPGGTGPLFAGPFDGVDEEGLPLIPPHVRNQVHQRRNPPGPPQGAPQGRPEGPGQPPPPPRPGRG
jgi:hypothetical protein